MVLNCYRTLGRSYSNKDKRPPSTIKGSLSDQPASCWFIGTFKGPGPLRRLGIDHCCWQAVEFPTAGAARQPWEGSAQSRHLRCQGTHRWAAAG